MGKLVVIANRKKRNARRHVMQDQMDGRPNNPSERAPILQPLLTVKEVADYLRVTPSALYVQRHRGEEPGALGIRVGKRILYRPADIDRFLNEKQARILHRPSL